MLKSKHFLSKTKNYNTFRFMHSALGSHKLSSGFKHSSISKHVWFSLLACSIPTPAGAFPVKPMGQPLHLKPGDKSIHFSKHGLVSAH